MWEIRGALLLELLDSELKSLKRRGPLSGDDFEEIGYTMDSSYETGELEGEGHLSSWTESVFDHYTKSEFCCISLLEELA